MIKGLPEKLRGLRSQYGLSQKQVAQKLKISPSIVSGYETGERTPSAEIILSLAYLYNVSTDFLLGKQSIDPRIVIDVSQLTDKQRAAIVCLVESICDNK